MEQAGEGGSLWQARYPPLAGLGSGLVLCLLIGCTASGQRVEPIPTAQPPPGAPRAESSGPYRIACPDELEITTAHLPRISGPHVVGPDGRIDLGDLGRPRIDGKTATEAAAVIAERAGVSAAAIQVAVRTYRSQQVYLVGEVRSLQRAVPYQGPERVVELLQRVGGLTSGAALGDVYLIRSHLTAGRSPEVLRVDVSAIMTKHEQRTNFIVQPFDQITVGETRQSILARSLPPFFLPFYQSLFGLQP